MPVWFGGSGVDRTTEAASLREQLGLMNNKNKESGQKKDERPQERGWDVVQPNRKIGEKPDEMGRPLGKDERRGGKTSRMQEKGKATAEMGGLREDVYEKIGGG